MTPGFRVLDLWYQAPLLVLVVFGLLLVVIEAFVSGKRRDFMIHLTVAGCVAAAVCGVILYRGLGDQSEPLFGGMLVADQLGMFFAVLVSLAAAVTAMVLGAHQREHDWQVGEVYPILLLAAAGMVMMAMAGDLVTVFLGIETMSLGVYVLTAARRRSRRSTEAAMKYFLMGAFATAILLYGIGLVYGATGTTSLDGIRAAVVSAGPTPLLVVGVFLLIGAFAFKIAAIPFHMWAPDAYEGAPTPVTGFMATAVKVAAFAAILRVFAGAFGGDVMPYGKMGWASIFAALAAATMVVGNIAALRQENIKRMLAYSSISHAGVVLVGVVALGVGAGDSARAAILYYLAAYTVTTLGAFAVVTWVGNKDAERLLVSDMNGLGRKRPAAAVAMTVLMLSLGGIPPTAGFFAKFYVFMAAVQAYDQQLLWLVVVGVLTSAIGIFYYLRVVTAMYFRNAQGDFELSRSAALAFVVAVCALLTLEMGILPGFWLGLAG